MTPSFLMIAVIALVGGALGVLFMIPLRSALIVKEHGVLPYPEGTACAEVLMAGEEGGTKAGAVAAGGIMSLIKSLPLIVTTFKDSVKDFGADRGIITRTNKDLNFKIVIGLVIALVVLMMILPTVPVGISGALIILVFGFFFATVSSRMVGLVGSSNNPVSGMTIATLLIATIILKASGNIGTNGMVAAICIGSIIAIIAAISGDTSQDLKTGYIVGATPVKQQIGELIGVVVSALAIGGILSLLNTAWGFGSIELPAPQATLMKMVVEGVMNGNLPWNLVFVGVGIAIVVEILKIPVLPFAIGLYLPIHLSTPIMVGGLIKWFVESRKYKTDHQKNEVVTGGTLFTSGLIAGEGLIGILLAVFAIIPMGIDAEGETISLGNKMDLGAPLGQIGALVFFALLIIFILRETIWSKTAKAEK